MARKRLSAADIRKSRLISMPPELRGEAIDQNPLDVMGGDLPVPLPPDQPVWLTVEDAITEAKSIQEVLSKKEWDDRFDQITSAMFRRAINDADPGANKAAELLLNYRYGKPVAIDLSVNQSEITGEDMQKIVQHLKDSGAVDVD